MNPQDLQRIHDAATGPLRRYQRIKSSMLNYTNSLYGAVIRPREEALRQFADELLAVVSATHHVHRCGPSSSRWITLHFPDLPPPPGRFLFQGGEISIHLPESRDDAHPFHSKRWVRTFPFVTIRMPGDPNNVRRYQLRPRETPAQIWQRCRRFMTVHAKETATQLAA